MAQVEALPPQEVKTLMDGGAPYLDVRSEGEFAAGHPAGAVNIPIGRPGPDGLGIVPNERFLLEVLEKFPLRDDKLLVGCKAGGRSARAVEALQQVQYSNLVDVKGGFGAWQSADLPVNRAGLVGACKAARFVDEQEQGK